MIGQRHDPSTQAVEAPRKHSPDLVDVQHSVGSETKKQEASQERGLSYHTRRKIANCESVLFVDGPGVAVHAQRNASVRCGSDDVIVGVSAQPV